MILIAAIVLLTVQNGRFLFSSTFLTCACNDFAKSMDEQMVTIE